MKLPNGLQLSAAILETLFAIPILGGTIILGLMWIPLALALVLHIVALVFTQKANSSKTGPIIGIVASVLGFIPFVGWLLHVSAAVFNWIGAFKK